MLFCACFCYYSAISFVTGMMKKTIKVGAVSLLVSEIGSGAYKGRYRVQGHIDGKHRVIGIYKDAKKAEKKAREKARDILKGNDALASLTEDEKKICLVAIESGITLKDIRDIAARRKGLRSAMLGKVLQEWYDSRTRRNDFSVYHVRLMKYVKDHLPEYLGKNKRVGNITTADLDRWLDSMESGAKRIKNIRGMLVSFWKWLVAQGYAKENIAAVVEIPRIQKRSGGHEVLLPTEYALMLHNVDEAYLPWLAIAGFSGLRTSEICGSEGRLGDRLTWEDFDWKNKRIIVRPETAKVSLPRFVPICDALLDWLSPWKKSTGFVHNARHPGY